MKTPEELAVDYVQAWWGPREDNMTLATRQSFLAGYQAGRSNSEAVQAAAPQWISVKQQMPDVHEEVLVNIVYPIERIEKLAYRFEGNKVEWFVLPDPQGYFWNEEWITHCIRRTDVRVQSGTRTTQERLTWNIQTAAYSSCATRKARSPQTGVAR